MRDEEVCDHGGGGGGGGGNMTTPFIMSSTLSQEVHCRVRSPQRSHSAKKHRFRQGRRFLGSPLTCTQHLCTKRHKCFTLLSREGQHPLLH